MHSKPILLLAWTLCALSLLSGCGTMPEERSAEIYDLTGIRAGSALPVADGRVPTRVTRLIYLPAEDGEALEASAQELSVEGKAEEMRALLTLQLAGLQSQRRGSWPRVEGGEEATVRIAGAFAIVNLPSGYRMIDPTALYGLRQAIAQTFGAAGIPHTLVLTDGREEGIDLAGTMPAGVFAPIPPRALGETYNKLEQERQSHEAFIRTAAIFLPSADGRRLCPVVRTVTCDDASSVSCLYAVLGALGEAGKDPLLHSAIPAPMDYMEEMPEIVRSEDGGRRLIQLHFTKGLQEALDAASLPMRTYLGMLAESLMGFVPGVDGLACTLGDLPLAVDGSLIRNKQGAAFVWRDYDELLGAPAKVYSTGRAGGLSPDWAILPWDQAQDVRSLLKVMMERPQGLRALPDGLTDADVLAVRIEKENVILSLSEAFYQRLCEMEEGAARRAIYAIVDTLVECTDRSGVIFFFGGEQKDEIHGIVMRGRLMRNPGIIE